MNKLMAKIDTNEELDYDHNSFHSLSESYQLHAEFRRKNDLDIVSSNNVLFYWKLKDFSSYLSHRWYVDNFFVPALSRINIVPSNF